MLGEDQDPSGSLCTIGCCEISSSFHIPIPIQSVQFISRWFFPTSFCPFSVSGGGVIPLYHCRSPPWCLSFQVSSSRSLLKLKLPFGFSGRHFHHQFIIFIFVSSRSCSLFNSHPPSPVFGSSLLFWKVRKESFIFPGGNPPPTLVNNSQHVNTLL